MKKRIKMIMLLLVLGLISTAPKAQSYEAQCLLLDCSKLAQLKSILSDMKKGYEVLTGGYNAVKDMSEGNFRLHKVFLDNLMKVSPVVQNYKKVAEIINDELQLLKECKGAWRRYGNNKNFNPQELIYMNGVYRQLMEESLKKLDDLTVVISPGMLRMSDDERLLRIDELEADMHDKLTFLRHFNGKTSLLSMQRLNEQNDISTSNSLYGIK